MQDWRSRRGVGQRGGRLSAGPRLRPGRRGARGSARSAARRSRTRRQLEKLAVARPCRAQEARTLRPLARHWLIQCRHYCSFRSSGTLPGALIVPSFRRDYTTPVKNAICRRDTLLLPESLLPCGRGRRLRRKRHTPEQVTHVSNPLWNGDSSRRGHLPGVRRRSSGKKPQGSRHRKGRRMPRSMCLQQIGGIAVRAEVLRTGAREVHLSGRATRHGRDCDHGNSSDSGSGRRAADRR